MFSMMGGGVSEGYIVAHMKNALRLPTAHAEWNIQPAVDRLRSSLGETNYQFLKALAEAVNDASAMPHLDEFSQWRNAPECASD